MKFWILFTFILLLLTLYGSLAKSRKIANIFYWSAVTVLSVVSILRFDVGMDYMSYWNACPMNESFFDIINGTTETATDRFEFLARLIYGIVAFFNYPPLFFIIAGGIIYGLSFWSIYKYTNSPLIGFWLYWGILYLFTLNGIRQAIAISIVLYAYQFIKDKAFFKYLLMVFIAFLFHKSAALCICFYPLYHYISIKMTILLSLILIFCSNVIANFIFGNFSPHQLYALHGVFLGGFYKVFFHLVIIITILLFQMQTKYLDFESRHLLPILILGVTLPFVFGMHFGLRLSFYCLIFEVFLLCKLLLIKKIKRFYRITIIFLFITYPLVSIYRSAFHPVKDEFSPYRCILFTDTTVFK